MPNNDNNHPLVEILRQHGEFIDPYVAAAFWQVPRGLFLPGVPEEIVNSDTSVDITFDKDGEVVCSAAMPSTIAYMLRQLEPHNGLNVLEIGTGTGYSAALMRHLVGQTGNVTTLELDSIATQMAQDNLQRAGISGVTVVNTDGSMGYATHSPYDRIVATVGLWDVPPVWVHQLKKDGLLVVPIWLDGIQVSAAFEPQPDGSLLSTRNMPTAFVYLRGALAGPNVRKRIGSTGLTLLTDDARQIDSAAMSLLLADDYDHCHLGYPLDSTEYWYGFLPYLMLRETENDIFALYYVAEGLSAFGVDGKGFAFFSPGSACFVPYLGLGLTHCFAGADAFLTVEQHLHEWNLAERPGIDCLRLRLIPKAQGKPHITIGKIYERRDHYLHVWQELPEKDDISKSQPDQNNADQSAADNHAA